MIYQNVAIVAKGNVPTVNGLHNVQPVMNMDFVGTVKIMLNCVDRVAAAVNVALIAIIVANHICLQIKIAMIVGNKRGIEEISAIKEGSARIHQEEAKSYTSKGH